MKLDLKKYFSEGLLIVFSVLFALTINKVFADYQTNQKKDIALSSIRQELQQNADILDRWKTHHTEIRDRISSILEGSADSLLSELKQYEYLNMGVLTNNRSLIDAILVDTAWESAKATGIIAEFDFQTTQQLTRVYALQEIIVDRTVANILDFYFDMEAHNIENLESVLVQFQLRFWELTGQEILIARFYENAIEQLASG